MVEFHHIHRWADRAKHGKTTDLQNGLPLCGFHNRLMEAGWKVSVDPDCIAWFTPPATLDPTRTPIRGSHLSDRRAA